MRQICVLRKKRREEAAGGAAKGKAGRFGANVTEGDAAGEAAQGLSAASVAAWSSGVAVAIVDVAG